MKPSSWVVLTLVLIIIATVLQIGGVAAPLWIFLEPDSGNYTIGVGLFFRVGCESSTGALCSAVTETLPFGYTEADTYDNDLWPHITWLETLAAMLGILLCVMASVYLMGFGVWRKLGGLNTVMIITAIIAWIAIAVGLIIYAIEYGKVITRSPDVSAISFPWSALMCFLAGIIFIIVTILIHTKCRVKSYVKHSIPPSADTKMILNPSTKSQLLNRFFTPSPYREDRRHALQSSAYYSDQSALLGAGGSTSKMITNGFVNRGFDYGVENQRVSNMVTGVQNTTTEIIDDSRVVNGGGRVETRMIEADVRRAAEEEANTRGRENVYMTRISTVENNPYNYNRIITRDQQEFQDQQRNQQQQQQQQQQQVITRTTATATNQYRTGVEGREFGGEQRFSYTQPAPIPAQIVDRGQEIVDRRQEVADRRQEIVDRRQEVADRRQEDQQRIVGTTSVLQRHRDWGVFDNRSIEDDAETIYYTGRYSEPRPRPLYIDTDVYQNDAYRTRNDAYQTQTQTDVYRTDETRTVQNDVRQGGFVQQTGNVITQETRVVAEPEVEIREINIIERQKSNRDKAKFFRVRAGMEANPEWSKESHFTTHMRAETAPQGEYQNVLSPDDLRDGGIGGAGGNGRDRGNDAAVGKGVTYNYNDMYIYRPYSEHLY